VSDRYNAVLMTQPSFLWHDFETFGADPRRDRPSQFAALRTDENLQPVEEPVVLYCQPADDMLPQPMACLITGITPQMARDRGQPEHQFADRIHDLMSRPGTCSVGFNNFRFDDEVTRHLFWRNFFDPYAREYANGNSRFDLIDVLRMTRALRPEGIEWANRADGIPSFRLEDLAAANGMDTSRAHDALADVEATIAMARLLRQHQPRLWDWALGLRQKHVVAGLLQKAEPLLHSSARFPASQCGTAPILPLAPHPRFSGQWIVWNLNVDPEPFSALDHDELLDCLWTPREELPDGFERLPIKLVRSNRCPMLSPMAVLDDGAQERLQIDPEIVQRHVQSLRASTELVEKLAGLFDDRQETPSTMGRDPELALYDGFVPRNDQQLFVRIRELDGSGLARLGSPFSDERLNHLLFRYRARLFPQSLDEQELEQWQLERQRRLVSDPDLASIRWPDYQKAMSELMTTHPDRRDVLEALMQWPTEIGLYPDSENNESMS
jgi:exodeoxyribonuclease I